MPDRLSSMGAAAGLVRRLLRPERGKRGEILELLIWLSAGWALTALLFRLRGLFRALQSYNRCDRISARGIIPKTSPSCSRRHTTSTINAADTMLQIFLAEQQRSARRETTRSGRAR
jgi:hypothetical protein